MNILIKISNRSGFSALLAVVIIGAASLIMLRSLSLLSIGELNMGYTFMKGRQTAYLADSCAEEALRRLQLNENFTANNLEVPFGGNSCIINITANGNERIISSLGRMGMYNKKIQVNATIVDGSITVNSWTDKEL